MPTLNAARQSSPTSFDRFIRLISGVCARARAVGGAMVATVGCMARGAHPTLLLTVLAIFFSAPPLASAASLPECELVDASGIKLNECTDPIEVLYAVALFGSSYPYLPPRPPNFLQVRFSGKPSPRICKRLTPSNLNGETCSLLPVNRSHGPTLPIRRARASLGRPKPSELLTGRTVSLQITIILVMDFVAFPAGSTTKS